MVSLSPRGSSAIELDLPNNRWQRQNIDHLPDSFRWPVLRW